MELKPGYKRTEVGVIPEDWKIEKLGDCLLGAPQYGINAPAVQYTDSLPIYIRITDITDDGCFSPVKIASVRHVSVDKYVLKAGDLVFARTGASVGKTYLCKPEDGNLVFAGYLIRVKVNPSKLLPDYLAAYVKTGHYWSWVRAMSMRSGQPGINGNEYARLPIPLPSPPEQQAIAAALSDVDALITSLDRLIAKKRDIKHATMQQLLTGKTRLLGFSGELKLTYKQTEVGLIPEDWEVHTLGEEVDQLEAGVSVNSVDEDFHMYAHAQAILKTSAVSNGYFFPHENKKIAPRDIRRAKLNPRVNSIIISRMNTLDLVGECGYVDKDYPNLFLPDRLWMTRFNRESTINVKWLSYLLSHKEYKVKIKVAATGTSGSMKNISKDSLLSIKIPFPSPEEQTAIATILSDMDAEIAALEQKRDKTRALKQGMMQELLTGKTRLL